MPSITLKLPASQADALEIFFLAGGFDMGEAEHAFWRGKGPGCNATFYRSGKLLLQGKEADAWRARLAEEQPDAAPYAAALARHPSPAPQRWAGTDEAGKGDWLGPLVVAGVAIRREDLELLQQIGIDDSKALSDAKLPAMAREVATFCAWDVLVIGPRRYNELYEKIRNINTLLAWAHGKVIGTLRAKAPDLEWVLIDRFASDRRLAPAIDPEAGPVPWSAWPKAESDPAVGAASVLARASYLKQMRLLSDRFGLHLHPGAGPPALRAGRAFVEAHGRGALHEVAKIHFASTQSIGG